MPTYLDNLRHDKYVVLSPSSINGPKYRGQVIDTDDVIVQNIRSLVEQGLLMPLPWGIELVEYADVVWVSPDAVEEYQITVEGYVAPEEEADDLNDGGKGNGAQGTEPGPSSPGDTPQDTEALLSELRKLNRSDLAARAIELGVMFEDGDTKAEIIAAIEAHLSEAPPTD